MKFKLKSTVLLILIILFVFPFLLCFFAGGYYGHAPVVSAGYGVSKVVSPYGVAPSVYSGYGVAAAPVGWYFLM